MNKINLTYPLSLNVNGNLSTNLATKNNKSRLNLLLDIRRGQRFYHPDYCSRFEELEQDSIDADQSILSSIMLDFKNAIYNYMKDYLSISDIVLSEVNRELSLNVNIIQ